MLPSNLSPAAAVIGRTTNTVGPRQTGRRGPRRVTMEPDTDAWTWTPTRHRGPQRIDVDPKPDDLATRTQLDPPCAPAAATPPPTTAGRSHVWTQANDIQTTLPHSLRDPLASTVDPDPLAWTTTP